MNVLYTLDKGFVPQLFVSLKTLINNTFKMINIYIICDGISNEDKNKLMFFDDDRVSILFLKAPHIPNKLIPDRGSRSQFYRLSITEIFKSIDIDRILYLDADTMVMSRNIEDMYSSNLDGHVLGATTDPWAKSYRDLLNIDSDAKMFNSGIMLIDVNLWNKYNLDEEVKKIVASRKDFIQGDQGVLNELFNGRYEELNPQFNVISSYFELKYEDLIRFRKPIAFYSKKSIEDAVRKPVIIHYTSTFMQNRPWNLKSEHKYRDKWLEEYQNTCGKKYVLRKGKVGISMYIYKFLPHNLAINILGFLQANIRPLLYRMKRIFLL